MNHAQLSHALRSLERGIPDMRSGHAGDFRHQFETQVAQLSAQAEDPDDVVYVIERADTMLGDIGFD